ncbi:adenine guanine permease AZG1 [Micractinium conductrix]|uniref:Adenine guanine permease AZG1 n=1 Tax=Micractinium conductrix TaxID=554055 RepID=A0A2P6VKP3_9CHLO|nr:adenine guanine permease AZG1 [Micractinium conductrix]|eukprot:PSC74630.1 adenine guanine permease AZG1 [Micractinium conductrix]
MGMFDHLKLPPGPKDKSLGGIFEWQFRIKERGSTVTREIRAGLVLFLVSVFSVLLNPVILSGAASGYNTGMPPTDVALATAISSGAGTLVMGMVGNYPWVLGVQLGTNNYFVDSVVGQKVCGANAFFTPTDDICPGQPCTCTEGADGTQTVDQIGTAADPGPCFGTVNTCLGSKIAYQKALAATFLEGLVFFIICITGLRAILLKRIPRCILIAGACGIGVFIMFVGWKGMGVVVADKYPNLVRLNTETQYGPSGWGDGSEETGIGFNSCVMLLNLPPYGPVCPWLSVGGLVFTSILMLWNVPSAFLTGCLFTTFIAWIRFPNKVSQGGLVPDKVAYAPSFSETAGSLSFDWSGQVGPLVGALVTFLYLDFIGSAITFCSLGQMAGLLNEEGDIPNSNIAFIADAIASMLGGLLGSSAIVCYVESASGMREGGRTGFAAVVCAVLFFLSSFLSPLFGQIPSIATSPILVLVGVLIFASAVSDINWEDYTEAIPVLVTITIMPFTSNIAYGIIGGIAGYLITKFFTYQLFSFQQSWPGVNLYKKWSSSYSMFVPYPGWNCGTENTMTYDAAIQKALGSKAKLDVLDPSPSPSLPSTEADGKLETAEKGVRTEGVPGESAHGGL